MTALEIFGAALLLLGSALVLFAVRYADQLGGDATPRPVQPRIKAPDDEPVTLRRAA